MHLILEEQPDEDYFEIVLTEKELQDITALKGAMGICLGGLWDSKNLNVFIRKQNLGEFQDAVS
jgi:hypothetical protein